jgi:hypothetical protein
MTERKLVSIREIADLQPIDGADAIEVATVDGWKLVVKKGEFKVGDHCVYFEIDSFLPKSDPRFAFIMRSGVRTFEGEEGHKLRTIKLRGQISQGLALPVGLFPELMIGNQLQNGEDITAVLGIKKWEAAIPAELAGQVEGLFPSFIRKTDQERCQNLGKRIFGYVDTYEDFEVGNIPPESIARMIEKGDLVTIDGVQKRVHKAEADINDEYEVTLKLDGTSVTFFHRDGEIGVCSRNLQLKINEENQSNALVRMFIDSGLSEAIKHLGNIAIQGELMGPGIQKNREGFKENQFFVFDIQNIDTGKYFDPMTRQLLVSELLMNGVKVKHVPIIAQRAKLLDTLGLKSVDDLLKFAERKSINHDVAEGVVFKRVDGAFSFKAISNKFLEKEKD